MKYIIYAGGDHKTAQYCDKVGGSVVLYELGKRLQKKGQDVYMLCKKSIGDLPAIDENDAELLKNESWIIYPESIWGNPMNMKNVIRWLLYNPNVFGNTSTWNESDLKYKFCEYFTSDEFMCEPGYLRTNEYKLDIFKNKNLANRNIDCHLLRKFVGVYTIYHKIDSKSLDGNVYSMQELADIFNNTNIFICYDNATYYSIMAALCGATSVIIPDKNINMTREEFMHKFPLFKYGVAYGMDDIEWANSTKHLVKDYLLELDRESDKWLDMFIENTTKKFRI